MIGHFPKFTIFQPHLLSPAFSARRFHSKTQLLSPAKPLKLKQTVEPLRKCCLNADTPSHQHRYREQLRCPGRY